MMIHRQHNWLGTGLTIQSESFELEDSDVLV